MRVSGSAERDMEQIVACTLKYTVARAKGEVALHRVSSVDFPPLTYLPAEFARNSRARLLQSSIFLGDASAGAWGDH